VAIPLFASPLCTKSLLIVTERTLSLCRSSTITGAAPARPVTAHICAHGLVATLSEFSRVVVVVVYRGGGALPWSWFIVVVVPCHARAHSGGRTHTTVVALFGYCCHSHGCGCGKVCGVGGCDRHGKMACAVHQEKPPALVRDKPR